MSKTAVITGATGQLGRQVVKAFDKDGWNVIGTGEPLLFHPKQQGS